MEEKRENINRFCKLFLCENHNLQELCYEKYLQILFIGEPLIVYISISLRNILDIDELRQVILVTLTLCMAKSCFSLSADSPGNHDETLLERLSAKCECL